MRSLDNQELGQVAGGYYTNSVVSGAGAGVLFGTVAGVALQFTGAAAIPAVLSVMMVGAGIGAVANLLDDVTTDLDASLWSKYYQKQSTTTA